MLPFDGTIKYNRFAELVRNSEYDGTLMLEVFRTQEFYDGVAPEDFIVKAVDTVKKLRDMVDGK